MKLPRLRDIRNHTDGTPMHAARSDRLLRAAHALGEALARRLNIDASLELWDGSRIPLGDVITRPLAIRIASPGVIASLLRRPTLERAVRHYALGHISIEGGTLIDLGLPFAMGKKGGKLGAHDIWGLIRMLAPFLTVPAERHERTRDFAGDAAGLSRDKSDNRDFIQFHYDVGNDFYRLFLDERMVYSCAYFTDWTNGIDQAQTDKIDMICRKLRLKPGERLLDIGCGWGALICHAAEHYGVRAHGITLSQEQIALCRERIAARGLGDKVTVEIKDYQDLDGRYDKISSIGMYEHIGLENIPWYFTKIRGLLADGGIFLNHAISRRASRKGRRFGSRPEHKVILKYIFPGGALDDIGHSLQAMEQAGFAVHDVEGWREHYARTTRIWCERLTARRAEAEALVGAETYRIWVAYLAGVSLAFTRGSLQIFQTVAARTPRGASPMPPTRADLYR
jgi:cyclopropane-fatty-acyl-phospholipid synthase